MKFEMDCPYCHKTVKPNITAEESIVKNVFPIRCVDRVLTIYVSCPKCTHIWYGKRMDMEKTPISRFSYSEYKSKDRYDWDNISEDYENGWIN